MTDGRSLVRNSAYNVIGLVVPLLLAVAAIPLLVRGYGVERFGILTLAWAAVGYFNLFELGLSRALTQAVARRLGSDEQSGVAGVVWTTLVLLFALGVLAGAVLAASTPAIVDRALSLPADLGREASTSFYILALALPLTLMSAGLRGLMEAHHHFGAVNAIRLPLSAITFLGPLSVLPFSQSLVPAVVVLVAGRALGWVAHLVLCLRRYDYLKERIVVRASLVGPLVRYGGWATVSTVVSPLMVYMDRFLIGAVLTVAAVTHYVTPFEVVTKLMIVPGAVLAAVFPAFAGLAADRERMAALYDRAQRMVLLVIFPLLLPLVALAHEGLRIWMGASLPAESALVLQWLAVGIFVNAMAHAPYTALQGAGRPDLVARIHMAELPFYAVALWWLLARYGIVGVAMAWALRAMVDTAALLWVAHRTLALPLLVSRVQNRLVALMFLALVGATVIDGTTSRILYVTIAMLLFAWLTWRQLLTTSERGSLVLWLRSARLSRPPEAA